MNGRRDNSDFFSGLDLVSTFLFANFMWVVFSMTIIGMPLATVGLFAMMSRWVRGRRPEFFKDFLGAIREKWSKAIILGVIDLAVGGLLFINFSILMLMDAGDIMAVFSRSLTFFSAVLLLISNIYIWFLLASVDLPLKALIRFGLLLALTYPLKSIGIAVLTLIPVFITLLLPSLFILFITASTTAYIASRGAWWIVQDHLSVQELQDLNLL